MSQTEKRSTVEINRYYHGLTAVVMLMISAGILVIPFLIEMFKSSKGYEAAIPFLPYIAVLYLLKAIRLYFASPYGVLKYTKPLPVFYLIVSVIKISFMLLLIQSYGIYGVVASTCIAALAELVLLRYGVRDKFQFQFNYMKILAAPLVLFVTVLVLEPVLGQQFAWQVHVAYVALVLVFLLWTYRNELPMISVPKVLK
jgi:O-antigen/teichoic acid export membrane protein